MGEEDSGCAESLLWSGWRVSFSTGSLCCAPLSCLSSLFYILCQFTPIYIAISCALCNSVCCKDRVSSVAIWALNPSLSCWSSVISVCSVDRSLLRLNLHRAYLCAWLWGCCWSGVLSELFAGRRSSPWAGPFLPLALWISSSCQCNSSVDGLSCARRVSVFCLI